MRIRFSDEEQFNNAAILWEANQERSLKSAKGQAALRRLEAALLALPEPKLIADAIEDADGLVCGLGALAKHEGYQGSLELPRYPADTASNEEWDKWYASGGDDHHGETIKQAMLDLARALDVPRLVAIAIIYENDDDYGTRTSEHRYAKVLAFVRRWLTRDCSTWTQKNMEGYIA